MNLTNGIPWRESGWRHLPWAMFVVVLDQWSKAWIESRFQLGEFMVITSWFDLTRLHNPGAAFSFLAGAGGWQRWFFTALALLVSAALVVWLRGLARRSEPVLAVALACVLAGALGNVIDRLEHGFVIDFIHLHWQSWYFPAFNVADVSITVGAILLLWDALRDIRRRP